MPANKHKPEEIIEKHAGEIRPLTLANKIVARVEIAKGEGERQKRRFVVRCEMAAPLQFDHQALQCLVVHIVLPSMAGAQASQSLVAMKAGDGRLLTQIIFVVPRIMKHS